GGVWRYDEPQFARYRYFTQWDAEIYGVADPSADAEIIALSSDILESVGLKDHLVKISNRKLIEGLLRGLGIQSQNDLDHLIRIIDKMGKIGSEQAEREITRAGLSKDRVKRVLGVADMGGETDTVPGELESERHREDRSHKGGKQRPLSKQLEYADSLKVKISLVLGPREVKEGSVRLKDMKTSQEKNVKLSSLVDEIQNAIQ